MSDVIVCLRNLQENRHGTLLDGMVAQGHNVSLAHCLSQCVGCRKGPALSMDGEWMGAGSEEELKQAVAEKAIRIEQVAKEDEPFPNQPG